MRGDKLAFAVCAATCVSACSQASNEFIIDDPAGLAQSAELKICGKSTGLSKSGNQFRMRVPIGCEGEGSIKVRMPRGTITTCRVGYVTPGADQTFRFTLSGGQCR